MMLRKKITSTLDMVNPLIVNDSILAGGQPSKADFHYFKSLGISRVINLRPTTEIIEFDQFELMQTLNMDYHLIVIADGDDLTKNSAQKLVEALPTDGANCLFHCASGNRVGALLALKVYWFDGFNADRAIQFGLDSGMTKLLPIVKKSSKPL